MSRRTARSRRTTAPDGCARCPRSSSRRPLHAIWNLLLRRAGGSNTVAALSIVAEAVLLLPLAAAVLISSGGVPVGRFVPAIVVAAALALANYAALMAAYRRADLSLAYPVARGGVFLFLPLLGWRLLHETLTFPRFIGSSLITGGCVLAALL